MKHPKRESRRLNGTASDDRSGSVTAENPAALPLKLPRRSRNSRQQAYNCRESVFKMETPVRMRVRRFTAL